MRLDRNRFCIGTWFGITNVLACRREIDGFVANRTFVYSSDTDQICHICLERFSTFKSFPITCAIVACASLVPCAFFGALSTIVILNPPICTILTKALTIQLANRGKIAIVWQREAVPIFRVDTFFVNQIARDGEWAINFGIRHCIVFGLHFEVAQIEFFTSTNIEIATWEHFHIAERMPLSIISVRQSLICQNHHIALFASIVAIFKNGFIGGGGNFVYYDWHFVFGRCFYRTHVSATNALVYHALDEQLLASVVGEHFEIAGLVGRIDFYQTEMILIFGQWSICAVVVGIVEAANIREVVARSLSFVFRVRLLRNIRALPFGGKCVEIALVFGDGCRARFHLFGAHQQTAVGRKHIVYTIRIKVIFTIHIFTSLRNPAFFVTWFVFIESRCFTFRVIWLVRRIACAYQVEHLETNRIACGDNGLLHYTIFNIFMIERHYNVAPIECGIATINLVFVLFKFIRLVSLTSETLVGFGTHQAKCIVAIERECRSALWIHAIPATHVGFGSSTSQHLAPAIGSINYNLLLRIDFALLFSTHVLQIAERVFRAPLFSTDPNIGIFQTDDVVSWIVDCPQFNIARSLVVFREEEFATYVQFYFVRIHFAAQLNLHVIDAFNVMFHGHHSGVDVDHLNHWSRWIGTSRNYTVNHNLFAYTFSAIACAAWTRKCQRAFEWLSSHIGTRCEGNPKRSASRLNRRCAKRELTTITVRWFIYIHICSYPVCFNQYHGRSGLACLAADGYWRLDIDIGSESTINGSKHERSVFAISATVLNGIRITMSWPKVAHSSRSATKIEGFCATSRSL